MRTIKLNKALGRHVLPVAIEIDGSAASDGDTLDFQGESLALALYFALPGGTLDAMLAKLAALGCRAKGE